MRTRLKLSIAMSSTNAEDRDLGNGMYEVVTDSLEVGGSVKMTLVASEEGTLVYSAGSAASRIVVVRTTPRDPTQAAARVALHFNAPGNIDPVIVTPVGDAREGLFAGMLDGVTSIYASNLDDVDTHVTVFVAG